MIIMVFLIMMITATKTKTMIITPVMLYTLDVLDIVYTALNQTRRITNNKENSKRREELLGQVYIDSPSPSPLSPPHPIFLSLTGI